MKINGSISRKKNCHFKNGQKSIFEIGEEFKTAKNAISRTNFFDLFDFTNFLNFLASCEGRGYRIIILIALLLIYFER